MARPTLPDTATVGDAGHTTDHNTIAAALTELYDEVRLGAGTPEGAVTAGVGTLYRDTTNGLLYMKESGAGNTGWLPYAPTRITRPNTDDRLVEAWNGATWSVVDYDSGWRDITATLANGWAITGGGSLLLRRSGNTVHMGTNYGVLDGGVMTSDHFIETYLPGFWPVVASTIVAAGLIVGAGGTSFLYLAGASTIGYSFGVMWLTNEAPPASLPGTLVSAAPA